MAHAARILGSFFNPLLGLLPSICGELPLDLDASMSEIGGTITVVVLLFSSSSVSNSCSREGVPVGCELIIGNSLGISDGVDDGEFDFSELESVGAPEGGTCVDFSDGEALLTPCFKDGVEVGIKVETGVETVVGVSVGCFVGVSVLTGLESVDRGVFIHPGGDQGEASNNNGDPLPASIALSAC